MTLREYLFVNRIYAYEFAEFIGYTAPYVVDISNGRRIPSKKLASLIEAASGGQVEASQFDERRKVKGKPMTTFKEAMKSKRMRLLNAK